MTATRRALSRTELLLIFVFWTSLATLTAVNRFLDPRGGFHVVSPLGPIAMAFIESWFWAALTPLIFQLSSRFRMERSNWYTHLPLLILAGFVISIFAYVVLTYIRVEFFPIPRRRFGSFDPARGILRFHYLNHLIVYIAVLAAGFAREYFLRDQERQREAMELKAQLADARLDALRMQINPHFLFNTLHAVSALAEHDPAGVRRMIARLSELLRYTIESRSADEIPLRDEIDFLDRYLEIMEIRFQGRLQVKRRIDPETLDALVPNLILQPLLENALEHGVSRVPNGTVEIESKREDTHLVLAVRDNGPGPGEPTRAGIGLANVRARLEQLFRDAATMSVGAAPGGGFRAEIRLPFRLST